MPAITIASKIPDTAISTVTSVPFISRGKSSCKSPMAFLA